MEQLTQKANEAEITQALSSLLPPQTGYACCSSPDSQVLLAEEMPYLNTIRSPKRANEYILGRLAARAALKKLDNDNPQYQLRPLLKLDSGLVAWPAGTCGSISHSGAIAIAAVASTSDYSSLGIDIEYFRPVSEKVISRIASEQEMQILSSLQPSGNKSFFSIFSAKESIFKAVYPIVNKRFGFGAVRMTKLKDFRRLPQGGYVCNLEFTLEEKLSSDFDRGVILSVRLFMGDFFSLTFSCYGKDL